MTDTDGLSLRYQSFVFVFAEHSSIFIVDTIVKTAMTALSIAYIRDGNIHLKWYLFVCNETKERCTHQMCTRIAPNRWDKAAIDGKSISPTNDFVMTEVFIKKSFYYFLRVWSAISDHSIHQLQFLNFTFHEIHSRSFEIFVCLGSWDLMMDRWVQLFHWRLSYSGGDLLQYENREVWILAREPWDKRHPLRICDSVCLIPEISSAPHFDLEIVQKFANCDYSLVNQVYMLCILRLCEENFIEIPYP